MPVQRIPEVVVMKDQHKTKKQLISELQTLRQQSADLKRIESSEEILGSVADGISAATGEAFFQLLVRYRSLFEESRDAIVITTKDGKFLDANRAALELFGYNKKEFLKLDVKRIYANPNDRQTFVNTVERKGAVRDYEIKFQRKNDLQMDCLVTSSVRREKARNVVSFQSIIRDITQRKRAENKLRQSEEKYRMVVENSNEAIIIVRDGRVAFFNPRAQEISGYSPKELTMKSFAELVHPEDQHLLVTQFTKKEQSEKVTRVYTFRLLAKGGKTKWIEMNSVFVEWDAIPANLCFLNDITEHRRLQEELARAQRLESAGRVASQIAHDFNNLLSPLSAYPVLIREELPEKHPVLSMLDEMSEAANKIAEINQQLLALGRRGHYSMELINLNNLVHEVIMSQNLPKGITIKQQFASRLFPIEGGSTQLTRALINLLNNAREAMNDKGTLKITTENTYLDSPLKGYQTIARGEYVKLQISDSGAGIRPEIIDQIFDPFFTTKKMDRMRGSGLGLSVVHGIIKDHEGYILVDSKVGKGTTFSLFFPVSRKKASDIVDNDVQSMGGNERILVVDDDPIQRSVAKQLLKRLGYKVNVVSSGERAVSRIKNRPYDLVILDMVLEGMDGAETYRQILEIKPTQKAIILSGYAMTNRVQEALNLGAGTFISKPVTQRILANAVRKELDKKSKRMYVG